MARLSDRAYRLWVSCLLEMDDDGRMAFDLECVMAATWPLARPRMPQARRALEELTTSGLLAVYEASGASYAAMPSWHDHQRVKTTSYYRPSKLPDYKDSVSIPQEFAEHSASIPPLKEWNGREWKGMETALSAPGRGTSDAAAALMALWAEAVQRSRSLRPDLPGLVPVKALSKKRRKAALRCLTEGPLEFHQAAMAKLAASAFACGKLASNGRAWRASFDWYIREETNAIKAAEGRYDDAKA